jgi:hypothetical protein
MYFMLLVSFGSRLFDGTFVFFVVVVIRITNNGGKPDRSSRFAKLALKSSHALPISNQ